MKQAIVAVGFLLILSLAFISMTSIASSAQSANWGSYRGVAYRTAANSYPCVLNNLVRGNGCDAPLPAPPNTAFSVYKSAGFNFARIDLNWYYWLANPSGLQTTLTSEANACDANGVYCYYQGGGSADAPQPSWVNLWGCAGSYNCYLGHFVANDVIPSGSGTGYDNQPIWQVQATYMKSVIQYLDSHPSTVGYGFGNEPGSPWTNAQLIAFYKYMAQQLRTISTKAFIFQANQGGSGGGGAATIQQLAPTGYGPYVFEIHNYQGVLNYNPYPQVASDCSAAGCAGWFLGEWGASNSPPPNYTSESQFMTLEVTSAHNNGGGLQWFDYSGANPNTGALDATLTLLSQTYYQVLGGTPTTTTTSTSSSTTSTSTSSTSQSTTTTTSVTTTSTTTSASTSCSASGVCLSWGYAPIVVSPGVSTQWQGLVAVPLGTNPVGIPVSWYLDGSLAFSTSTSQGGAPLLGVSYFNTQLAQGTHKLYFTISNAQSPTLTIVAGSVTTTTTTSTTSTSSTSASTSSTTTFLSSSSSSSVSLSSTSTGKSTSVTTSNSPTISTSTGPTPISTTSGQTTTFSTISSQSTSSSSSASGTTLNSTGTSVSRTTTNPGSNTTSGSASSQNSGSSAYLYPTGSSLFIFLGPTGLAVFALVVVVKLREIKAR
ncbi:MAG TPA: hypothetical protein VGR53_09680 [Nitrososphaerales archaeon]|nr:hypothetical protein [Nitrososphaerales archaeon]